MRNNRIALNAAISVVAVLLLLASVIPTDVSGRVLAAALLLPAAVIATVFLKKRSLLSINKRTVFWILFLIALMYLCFYYLSGIYFGFVGNAAKWPDVIWRFAMPIVLAVASTEIARYAVRSQNDKWADTTLFIAAVIAETLIYSTVEIVSTFYGFIDFVGMALLPAVTANFLYHYMSVRFGPVPIIVYRLVTTLYLYLIPIKSSVPSSLVAFINLLLPVAIYYFLDALFEKKRRYALERNGKIATAVSLLLVALMASVMLLISNRFTYGTLVIATESMTGEINKGDALVFEKYDDQIITEGEIVVFEKNFTTYVHRVVEIERINGSNRYYTKGDANEERDSGYITDANIIGIGKMKVPYVGYPTLWLRNIFLEERS